MFNKDKMILQRIGLLPKDDDETMRGHWGTAPFTYRAGRLVVQPGELRYPIYRVPDVWANAIEIIEFRGTVVLPTDSSYLLAGCSQLKEVHGIDNWNAHNVESMAYLFLDDPNLHRADLADLDTRSVEDMQGVFQDTGFSDIDVSGWDFRNASDMSEMFSHDDRLEAIDMHDANTGNVRDWSRFIYGNPNLADIDVRGMDTSHAQDMNRMFAHNDVIPSIDIRGFTADKVDDMEYMFSTCPQLRSIPHIMNLCSDHYSKMGSMFTCDDKLDTITTMDHVRFYDHSNDSYEGIFY